MLKVYLLFLVLLSILLAPALSIYLIDPFTNPKVLGVE